MHKLLIVFIVLIGGSSLCSAQASDIKLKEVVKNDACVKAFASDPELVRITRREDLEDTLLGLQMDAPKRNYDQFFIFELSATGNFRISSGEIITVTSTGKSSRMIAASSSGQIYPLYGCSDAESAFSNLIMKAAVAISTRSAAEKFALFRYTLVEDPANDRLVFHSREFRHKAEDLFYTHLSPSAAEKRFKAWIKTYQKAEGKLTLGIHADQTATGFSTWVTYMNGSPEGLTRLYKSRMDINQLGEYTGLEKSLIFQK